MFKGVANENENIVARPEKASIRLYKRARVLLLTSTGLVLGFGLGLFIGDMQRSLDQNSQTKVAIAKISENRQPASESLEISRADELLGSPLHIEPQTISIRQHSATPPSGPIR